MSVQEAAFLFTILGMVVIGHITAQLASRDAYCAISGDHTACKYSRLDQRRECGRIKRLGLSPAEKQLIVDEHNSKRRLLAKGEQPGQPGASDMTKMTWDDEAAAIAQLWTDQCTFEHDAKRDTVKKGKEYNGQNLYWSAGYPEFNISNVINAWYDEVKQFDSSTVGSFNGGGQAGHYTQMIWAKSSRIGCGFVLQQRNNEMILTCNYVPGGNIFEAPLYKMGKPCSACPADMSNCDDGLCTP